MAQPPAPPKPPGSAYFEKKGEVHELRVLLRGAAADRDQQKKRDAIKKVIAYMTLGIDVSPLFSEMVMASATNDLVQKKMVYLYLVNYAESNSELAILAVNTLLKDCRDDDPMIRGLALRSLCSLSLMNMVEYLQPAVQRALEDTNGYVRKTAVIGVVKVFHISRSAVLDSDLLPTLKRLIQDSDAHVVGNAIVAVEEVCADEGGFQPTRDVVTNMLNRLQQFSEWGQCAVLRLLTKYQVADEAEMFDIMNILDSLLKQSSSAVVLAVTKIFLDLTSNRPDLQIEVLRRLKGPLLTLMAAATPELAYTVLVHIHAIVERGADAVEVFSADFKQFFCRYNDPSYIKNVKIDILTILADAASGAAGSSVDAKDIVTELSEYVTDVDAEISRRAIRAIGKIAVRRKSGEMLDSITEMIVDSLTDLLALDIDYVSTEAAVVMKDLVRKYPQQFQRASGAVERCMKIVNEPDGKCALLWILGEYGHLIEDAPYLLEPMIDGFLEEQSGAVRLEMLTAGVKLFFCRPPEMQAMLGRLLAKAIQESTHPDVRDRALLYYRLLEYSPDEAQRIICAPKEVVEEFQEEMDQELKDRIFDEFNSLSTVYKQTAAKFVLSKDSLTYKMQPPPPQGQMVQNNGSHRVFTDEQSPVANGPSNGALSPQVMTVSESTDLLGSYEGLGGSPTDGGVAVEPSPSAGSDLLGMGDLLGGDLGPTVMAPAQLPFSLVLDARMDGVDFEGRWSRLPALPPQSRPMRPVAVTTSMVEDALRRVGICVMASGTVDNSMKFYFYAKQHPETNFLMELIMVPGGLATCTLRVENAQQSSVERLSALLWETLVAYVHS